MVDKEVKQNEIVLGAVLWNWKRIEIKTVTKLLKQNSFKECMQIKRIENDDIYVIWFGTRHNFHIQPAVVIH